MLPILFIAHHFPPQGGAGVQRALKFAKHLPSLDIAPSILTAPQGIQTPWTPKDVTMEKEIPPEASVHRFDWPDYRNTSGNNLKLAQERLIEEGLRIALEKGAKVVIVSMSPFEDAYIAKSIASKAKIPWIADLRDPWALDEFQVHRTAIHRSIAKTRMGKSLEEAAAIIMNTPEAAKRLRAAFPRLAHSRISHITNGYDQDDFDRSTPKPRSDKFRIVHAGFLHTRFGLDQKRKSLFYRLLGSTRPGMQALSRSHYYILQALANWTQKSSKETPCLEIVLAGSLNNIDEVIIRKSGVESFVKRTGYLSHEDSVDLISDADLLFLPMHTLRPGDRSTFVPGKTYEYMATGNPILAAIPDGDAKDFLKECGTASICQPEDVDTMIEILKTQYQSWKEQVSDPTLDLQFVQQFERKNLAKKLAKIISEVV